MAAREAFQSTHSLRSATRLDVFRIPLIFVSIHALLAECDYYSFNSKLIPESFNPRTPCGVRRSQDNRKFVTFRFQSTHSLRSATCSRIRPDEIQWVSIHALLAECDSRTRCQSSKDTGFNPRTPCGVRHPDSDAALGCIPFQSTHSLRSATGWFVGVTANHVVSIHALLAECDPATFQMPPWTRRFNPRTPCGVRRRPTLYITTQQSKSYFAPTSLKRPSLHGYTF